MSWNVAYLTGGTFTPGTDWVPQFASASASGDSGQALGLLSTPDVVFGVLGWIEVNFYNFTNISIYIGSASDSGALGHSVQVSIAGDRTEYTAPGAQVLLCPPGIYTIFVSRETGPLLISGAADDTTMASSDSLVPRTAPP